MKNLFLHFRKKIKKEIFLLFLQVTSYGGRLAYTVYYDAAYGSDQLEVKPDVIISVSQHQLDIIHLIDSCNSYVYVEIYCQR